MLCAEGADPDIQATNGGTPLHNAASGGHLEAAEALLAANADVDVQNSNGNTPMHVAAAKGGLPRVAQHAVGVAGSLGLRVKQACA